MFYAKYSNRVTKSLSTIIAVMQYTLYIYYLKLLINIMISYAFVYIV